MPLPLCPLPVVAAVSWPHGQLVRGITLSGLESYNVTPALITQMRHQVRAAKHDWYANTIRLQVVQDRMTGSAGRHTNRAYMAALRAVAGYALRLHLTVVINCQTEAATGFGADEAMPDHATRVFWRQVMRWYADRPGVVFDLFNEPRGTGWQQWRASMQSLVNLIRRHASNQVWVEGLNWASTLDGLEPLHGAGIVYSFHKPGSPWTPPHPHSLPPTAAVWDAAFGRLTAAGVPAVDGEFGDYEGSYYWPHRPARTVKAYLAYLRAHCVGMLAWTLTAGALNGRTGGYGSVSEEPEGDGAAVRAWFRSLATDPPDCPGTARAGTVLAQGGH